ncbi:MAG: hypothetical protein WCQ21_07525 [Verrucomicrobiota bacterium]
MIARYISGAVAGGNGAVRLWLRGHGEAEGFVVIEQELDEAAYFTDERRA